MAEFNDHPLREQLVNELHARPFPVFKAPGWVIHLAFKTGRDRTGRDRAPECQHLNHLLDHFGAPRPPKGARHYFGAIGQHHLKWESHTEFFSYTLFIDHRHGQGFDVHGFDMLPKGWFQTAPGQRFSSVVIEVMSTSDAETIKQHLADHFVPESLSVSFVLDRAAVIASDFRLDEKGHVRMGLYVDERTGPQRIGRIIQRLAEIETYKAASMMGLERANEISASLVPYSDQLSALMAKMNSDEFDAADVLQDLLKVSAGLEQLEDQSSYRFSATMAYWRIVMQRIQVLREDRFEGRQTFEEFMTRRYIPSMGSVETAMVQLQNASSRSRRAGELLRTHVDVARSAHNQDVLESMDKRAELQLRLQHTVEGLSVVAISYYAVNLAAYAAYPIFSRLELSKGMTMALLTPPVIALIWFLIQRIKRKFTH